MGQGTAGPGATLQGLGPFSLPVTTPIPQPSASRAGLRAVTRAGHSLASSRCCHRPQAVKVAPGTGRGWGWAWLIRDQGWAGGRKAVPRAGGQVPASHSLFHRPPFHPNPHHGVPGSACCALSRGLGWPCPGGQTPAGGSREGQAQGAGLVPGFPYQEEIWNLTKKERENLSRWFLLVTLA